MFRFSLVLGLALAWANALAQSAGIGDATFPRLGNSGYRAYHYSLALQYDPDTNELRSDVTMDAVATATITSFDLDFEGFEIAKLLVNGVTAKYSRSNQKLHIVAPTAISGGGKFKVQTLYSGKPLQAQSAALPSGIKSGWIHFRGGAVAACEPDLAHTWFPCNDHPLNKATFDFEIKVPAGYIALANGVLVASSGPSVHFSLNKPSLTCMALVAVGKYTAISSTGPGGLPIKSYVPIGEPKATATSLSMLPKYIEFLTNRIGAYPFPSYGVIVLPKAAAAENQLMTSSALETTTLPIFGPDGAVEPNTLMHELAHQWLGNCVSVTHWGDDIWWVEGFAQYSEWLLTEYRFGIESYRKQGQSVYSQFRGRAWLKPGHLSAQEMFGAQSYIGGALTFYALRQTVGDELFFKIIRGFIDKNRYGNGTTQDWVEISSKVTGKDMGPFFREWLTSPTTPKLSR